VNYYELKSSLKKSNITESVRSYLQLIELTEEGKILINGLNTEFKTIEEARKHIKQEYISHKLEEQVSKESYEELSDDKVASIIKEYHDIKVTDTLIETYIQLASSNMFSVDSVVLEIRKLNKLDRLIENKLHYVLNDESIVAINPQTQDRLNNLFGDQKEIVEYMKESKDNFFYVVNKIKE
jgi:hypothetical protein